MGVEFENLIILQKLDVELIKVSLFLENFPAKLKEIDEKIEDSFHIISLAREKLSQNQKNRRDLEASLQDLKTRISKYKHQLNEVKTNKEYSSFLKEIEEAQQQIDHLEEEIISQMLEADDIEEEIRLANQKALKNKENFSAEKDLLFQEKKGQEERRNISLEKKKEIVSKIHPAQLNLYLKISKKKNGVVLSVVNDDFCSMCHMRIRPQVLNELREENDIILCENCGRILYISKNTT